jgi:hypothetical protein
MDETPTRTHAADMNAALVVARTNAEIIERLTWLFRRMAAMQEEIAVLLDEAVRRRESLPPTTQPT